MLGGLVANALPHRPEFWAEFTDARRFGCAGAGTGVHADRVLTWLVGLSPAWARATRLGVGAALAPV